jgi:hypothetical protein
MAAVIIPVLLSLLLGPGVGQLYNKEYKKGVLLIVVSFVVLLVAGVWYYKAVQAFLPGDLTTIDPQALPPLLTNATTQMNEKSGTLIFFFKAILMALWLYGVVDAYLVADKKRRV